MMTKKTTPTKKKPADKWPDQIFAAKCDGRMEDPLIYYLLEDLSSNNDVSEGDLVAIYKFSGVKKFRRSVAFLE